MIVIHIDNNTTVMSVFWEKQMGVLSENGMAISEKINSSMQYYSSSKRQWVVFPLCTFDTIGNKISNGMFSVISRQVNMCKVIH